MAIAIGVVIAAQGAIVGEKQLGTAAWVLSKPATRHAFVLAKFTTITLGFLVLAIVLPSIIFFGQIMFATGRVPPLGRFLAGGAVMLLHMLFYLALALLVGTFAHSRGPVAGTALGFLFAGLLVPDFLPQSAVVFPWKLADIAGGLALGGALPATWSISVIATALWTVLFIGVALWRFGREEF